MGEKYIREYFVSGSAKIKILTQEVAPKKRLKIPYTFAA
jgi:hypothetical protein